MKSAADDSLITAAVRDALTSDCDVVLIDLWDTLLIRNRDPQDVFLEIADRVSQLAEIELSGAELAWRYWDVQEAVGVLLSALGHDHEPRSRTTWRLTLVDLGLGAHVIDELLGAIADIEVGAHASACRATQGVSELLNGCEKAIVVSDMELSSDQLRRIAEHHGIFLGEIWVSSEHLLSKRTGRLFSAILSDRGLTPQRVFHVGDDPIADRASPAALGIAIPVAPLPQPAWRMQRHRAPVRLPALARSNESEAIEGIARSVAAFVRLIEEARQTYSSTSIILMGSEGAFFSQFISRGEGDSATHLVSLLGRKDLLLATLSTDPTWVVLQWALAGLSPARMGSLLQGFSPDGVVEWEEIARDLTEALCCDGDVPPKLLGPALERLASLKRACLSSLGLQSQVAPGAVLVVDVGYRATSARAIATLSDGPVVAAVMFGEEPYLRGPLASEAHTFAISDLRYSPRVSRGKTLPKVSLTLAIETLLAAGPRGPAFTPELERLRRAIVTSASMELDTNSENSLPTDPSVWWQMSDRPPHSIAAAILATTHSDDLLGKTGVATGNSRIARLRGEMTTWRAGAIAAQPRLVESALLAAQALARAGRDVRRWSQDRRQRP